jgi:methionyl-tRNA formyltransferase
MRLVMMGTGRFALPAFLGLYETAHEIVGLFTQPDRAGRGHHHHPHPMKEAAVERGTPVFQPDNVNTPASLADLRALAPDLCVVAAYGQILSAELLAIPPRGAINVHASLLPKYRGAAPVQYAIWCGEHETGITIFQIEPKLDAGPILAVERTPIGPRETSGELEERLAAIAAPLVRRVVDQIAAGTTEPQTQDAAGVTKAPRLRKEQGAIDWTKSPREIDCHIRAMQPWPTAYTFLPATAGHRARLIVLEVAPLGVPTGEPGTIAEASQRLVVHCGGGAVEIIRLKPEGKREMGAAEFLHGHTLHPGDRLDSQG